MTIGGEGGTAGTFGAVEACGVCETNPATRRTRGFAKRTLQAKTGGFCETNPTTEGARVLRNEPYERGGE